MDNYVTDAALCGNDRLDRDTAISFLVDDFLNCEEGEWVGCSVLLVLRKQETRDKAVANIRERAQQVGVRCDDDMVATIYHQLAENQAMLYCRDLGD